jgi:hypothetical protein
LIEVTQRQLGWQSQRVELLSLDIL